MESQMRKSYTGVLTADKCEQVGNWIQLKLLGT